ncbi:unnamed protein product [Didymodactylos carnosus]|uniref:Uncharacterized protein n=1 Tax=Didymodactylos carnosus TaxID=1234261 RepID=A0A814UYV5_9BILA|nr:unnamed protein product [Didymodactylos carnosus]CAF3945387.1 unnamed protein product [Didymodactylos carnosus]
MLTKFIPSSILKLLNQVFILQNYQQGSSDSRPTYQICKIYEMLFSASNGNCIRPLSFSESLMIYLFAGSSLSVKILDASSPSSSYETIHRWYQKQGNNNLVLPKGDIETTFDNNQIIGKSCSVFNPNKLSGVSTTVIHAVISEELRIQKQSLGLGLCCNEKKIQIACRQTTKKLNKSIESNDLLLHFLDERKYFQSSFESFITILKQKSL